MRFHAYNVPSFCMLPSVYLSVCFVHESVRASVQLEIHSPENTNKITDVLAFTCTTFHFISYFTASLYDRKYGLFVYGSGEINKLTHSWNS